MRETEYVAGVGLFGLAKSAIGVTVSRWSRFALFAFNITDIGMALIPIIAVLLVVGWAVGLIVIGLILRVGQGAEILAWGLLAFMMPLSGVFFPVSALPRFLQPIALLLPTTHVFVAARAVLAGHPFPWGQLAIAAVGAVVMGGWRSCTRRGCWPCSANAATSAGTPELDDLHDAVVGILAHDHVGPFTGGQDVTVQVDLVDVFPDRTGERGQLLVAVAGP